MMSFRETLWFKKGLLDADLAHASGDAFATNAADLLPIEDRYADDGTVSREDSKVLGLSTGVTQLLPLMERKSEEPSSNIKRMARELKSGRRTAVAVLGASVLGLCTVFVLYIC